MATLEALRNVPKVIARIEPARAELYQSLGVTLTYRREGDQEFVRVSAEIGPVDL